MSKILAKVIEADKKVVSAVDHYIDDDDYHTNYDTLCLINGKMVYIFNENNKANFKRDKIWYY